MDRSEILETLRASKAEAREKYRAELAGVFGSVARGDEKPDSDVDILLDPLAHMTLFDLTRLGRFLEEKLQRKVDLVSRRALRKELAPEVYGDLVPL